MDMVKKGGENLRIVVQKKFDFSPGCLEGLKFEYLV